MYSVIDYFRVFVALVHFLRWRNVYRKIFVVDIITQVHFSTASISELLLPVLLNTLCVDIIFNSKAI